MSPKKRLKVNYGDYNKELKNRVIGMVRVGNRKVNKIRVGENESLKHRELKESICQTFELLGYDFLTEAIIEKKGFSQRADILVPELALVIEIAVSEGDKSLESKRLVFEKLGLEMRIVRGKNNE